MFKRYTRNALSGLRLLLPLRVRAGEIMPATGSVIFFVIMAALVVAFFDYWQQYGEIYFHDAGAALLACFLLFYLLLAIGLSEAQAAPGRLLYLLTASSAALPWYVLALYGFRYFYGEGIEGELPWIAFAAWWFFAQLRAIGLALPGAALRALPAVALVTALTYGIARDTTILPQLFYSYAEEEYEAYDLVDQEAVFYRQDTLMDDRLRGLDPQRPGQADVYFVGFAGSGEETVFNDEVAYVTSLMDERFDTAGRSLKLINDLDRLDSEPLANTHNLAHALDQIGRWMDTDEDVLFLFLTSHGSEDGTLYVGLYPFDLKPVSAEWLRETLDRSGILWRIVVVSACYSGSFLEPLRDEFSLVMSASAADRNSFGCSNDRELTYFGEAFFQGELTGNRDLLASFEAARLRIEEMESDDDLTPSQPQIFIGERMREKLRSLWR